MGLHLARVLGLLSTNNAQVWNRVGKFGLSCVTLVYLSMTPKPRHKDEVEMYGAWPPALRDVNTP